MEQNGSEPIAELIEKLGEIKDMPLGPDRDAAYEEAQALFAPAAEEIALLGDHIEVLSAHHPANEHLAMVTKSASTVVTPQPIVPPGLLIKSRRETWKGYWNRKKGQIAIGMTIVAVGLFALNRRNVKLLEDFIHDEDLVGLFEDWSGIINEEERETPLDWRDRQDEID